MKILHMADIHLGAEPDQGRPWGSGRSEMLFEAFLKTLEAARQEGVELVLIAGDLFHRQPLRRELKEVNELFSRLGQTEVVLMAGNHDYLSKNSAYRSFIWHPNVHFFARETMESIVLPKLDTVVYGLSYEHREIRAPLYQNIEKKQVGGFHILLAHGGDEKHIPIRPKELAAQGFDYVALGHIHKPGQLIENRVVMAGALQSLDYNDPGTHGYWLAELKKGGAAVAFYPVQGYEYVHQEIEVTPEMTSRSLNEQVRAIIKEAGRQKIFKLLLRGQYDPDMEPEAARLDELDQVAAVVINCSPNYDYEKLKKEYAHQVIGHFIEEIEKMPPDAVTKKALYFGVEALLGRYL